MNSSREHDAETLRPDHDAGRHRIDDTMAPPGGGRQPLHLLDEVLGFFRRETADDETRLGQLGKKISHSASNTLHAVVDTVKQHPLPTVLIGGGLAWMIYASYRNRPPVPEDGSYYGHDREGDPLRYDPDQHFDRPLDYPGASASEASGPEETSKLGALKHQVAQKAAAAGQQLKDGLTRAGEMTTRATARSREACARTRERVATTADHYPLEVGLAALAAGLIAGLLLPTPNAVNRTVGPTADRLRERTREAGKEILEKSRHVADAAVSALKKEAQAQGLTLDRLREKLSALDDKAKEIAEKETRQEGLAS